MSQDRKALAGIEQTGDRRAKVALVCIEECFTHIGAHRKLTLKLPSAAYLLQNDTIYIFKKLIDVTT